MVLFASRTFLCYWICPGTFFLPFLISRADRLDKRIDIERLNK